MGQVDPLKFLPSAQCRATHAWPSGKMLRFKVTVIAASDGMPLAPNAQRANRRTFLSSFLSLYMASKSASASTSRMVNAVP